MNSALTLFWIVTGFSFAVGTVLTLIGLHRAPEGFEDESGFRYLHGAEAHENADHHGDGVHDSAELA